MSCLQAGSRSAQGKELGDVPFLVVIGASEGTYFAFAVGVSGSALHCSRFVGCAGVLAVRRCARGSGSRAGLVQYGDARVAIFFISTKSIRPYELTFT